MKNKTTRHCPLSVVNGLFLIKSCVALLCIVALTVACNDEEDCSLNGRPMMTCNLYTINEETGQSETISLTGNLTITAAGTDSIILNNATDVHTLTLPLRYTADSTVLVLHYGEEYPNDTLTIRQTNTPYFLSMDCGYQMKQNIVGGSYTRHLLDSIYIANKEAGIYGTENLKLFY